MLEFQFHKGTIRTQYLKDLAAKDIHFNSIKVRLERKFYIKDAWVKAFQFHKGTIRTRNQAMNR